MGPSRTGKSRCALEQRWNEPRQACGKPHVSKNMTAQGSPSEDIAVFLAHAIQLEKDAARRFEDLMHSMQTAGNKDVERLFRRLGELSRKHLFTATSRGGYRTIPDLAPGEFQWPEGLTPEAADWRGVDDALDVLGALELALEGEKSGFGWYAAIAEITKNPEVVRMARDFAEEERGHVSELERWIARQIALENPKGTKAPPP